MVVCTKSIMEVTNELCQRNVKGDTKNYYIFYILFAMKSSTEALMDVGADIVGVVKTNTQSFQRVSI